MKTDIVVRKTTNYGMFKLLRGNRDINPAHCANIKHQVEKHGCLASILIVNEHGEIIDGQHRFCVFQELGLPIYYIIQPGYKLKHVHIYNQDAKNWTLSQFMDSYAKMGKENYKIYKWFKEKYGFGHAECMVLLGGKSSNNGTTDEFKSGKFIVKDLQLATKIADKIYDFEPYYCGFKRRWFVNAYQKLITQIPGYDHKQMMLKIGYQSAKLTDKTTTKDYVRVLEKIYNFKSRDNYQRFDLVLK